MSLPFAATNDPHLMKILAFVEEIGLGIEQRSLPDDTFLPGLELGPGRIHVDFDKLLYPGDILHEAGHLAVTTSAQRAAVGSASLELPWPTEGEEIVAILWSYAAALHLQMPLNYLFHPNGYKGNSNWLLETFASGNFIGLPLLEWMGLTFSPEKAQQAQQEPFPVMRKWLRD